jgi:hypothetical protein
VSRPILARKDTKADEAKQRRLVTERDRNYCKFELLLKVGGKASWVMCGRNATDTAHVIRRHQCCKARFMPEVAIRACRECHNAFDRNVLGERGLLDVRVNPEFLKRAVEVVNQHSKVKIYG